MNHIDNTPLGKLALVTEETTQTSFLTGKYRGMPFSIQVTAPIAMEKIDFDFISDKLENATSYQDKAVAFLNAILLTSPASLGVSPSESKEMHGALVSFPEFVFGEDKDWSILFESWLPIADPYGILVNYQENEVVGVEDVSDAEEL